MNSPIGSAALNLRRATGALIVCLLLGAGAAEAGELQGRVWRDRNANGQADPGEPGLPGVTIYLDQNRNGAYDPGEPRARSRADSSSTPEDEMGEFWFLDVSPGTWALAAIAPAHSEQTYPLDVHVVAVSENDILGGLDFGFFEQLPGDVEGRVFRDSDRDGMQDPGEPGLAGITVYADLNANCVRDRDEPATVSLDDDPLTGADETGQYWLENLPPGEHVIRTDQPLDSAPVHPAGGAYTVLVSSATTTSGWNFGYLTWNAFATMNPPRLDLTGDVGEQIDAAVSWTVHPFCVRPYEVEILPSDPGAAAQSLSGVQLNGCGGDTTSFDVRFTMPSTLQCFQLEVHDAEFGGLLASIPVTMVPEPSFAAGLLVGAGGVVACGARRRARR